MEFDQFKWKNRLLFIFAPDVSHPVFDALKKEISARKTDVADRDLVIFEILEAGSSRIDEKPIDLQTANRLRERFAIPIGRFAVILVGKDGGTKLQRQEETRLEDIFGLIDSMPMRQQEIRKKAN